MKIASQLGRRVPVLNMQPDPAWVLPAQRIGIEIEVENCNPRTGNRLELEKYWSRHDDGSLRNNGMEWVTIDGLLGQDLSAALVCFNENRGRAWESTFRTGLHIHMDVCNMDIEPFARLCILYALTERLLFHWVGADRENNINCLPWYKAQADLPAIARLMSTLISPSSFQRTAANLSRYSALNLAALRKFGTIEFRHMQTTFDTETIKTWINLLMSLKKSSEDCWNNMGLSDIVEYATNNPLRFVRRVYHTLSPALTTNIQPEFAVPSCASVACDLIELYAPSNEVLPPEAWELQGNGTVYTATVPGVQNGPTLRGNQGPAGRDRFAEMQNYFQTMTDGLRPRGTPWPMPDEDDANEEEENT